MQQLAVEYVGGGVFEKRRVSVTPPAPDEVRIAVAYTGICGTDLTIASGAMDGRITTARPIGHEMSGTIDAVGADVVGWRAGDKVTVMPLDWCGVCPACRAGNSHICHDLDFVGIDSPGSLQEAWNVKADWLVRLPDTLDLRDGALVEPVAVAVHDVERGGVHAGQHVVVVGGGPIGILIAILARERGADVIVSEVAASRRELAAGLGFSTVDPSGQDLAGAIKAATGGAGADVAFEVSGSAAGVQAVIDALRVRGRGVMVGIHPRIPPVDLFSVFWKELELVGARVYQRTDFESAVQLVAEGRIPVATLVTHVLPLEDADAAITRSSDGGRVFKVLVASGAWNGNGTGADRQASRDGQASRNEHATPSPSGIRG